MGRARAPVGDARCVARNEERKGWEFVPVSGRRVAGNSFEESVSRTKGFRKVLSSTMEKNILACDLILIDFRDVTKRFKCHLTNLLVLLILLSHNH